MFKLATESQNNFMAGMALGYISNLFRFTNPQQSLSMLRKCLMMAKSCKSRYLESWALENLDQEDVAKELAEKMEENRAQARKLLGLI